MEFPRAFADGLEVFAVVVIEGFVVAALESFAIEYGDEADAIVCAILRERGVDEFGESGEEIHRVGVGFADAAFFNFSRPVEDEGDAVAAFEGDVFGASIGLGKFVAGGAVVGGENDDGVVGNAVVFEGFHHFTDACVHLLHDVATDAAL